GHARARRPERRVLGRIHRVLVQRDRQLHQERAVLARERDPFGPGRGAAHLPTPQRAAGTTSRLKRADTVKSTTSGHSSQSGTYSDVFGAKGATLTGGALPRKPGKAGGAVNQASSRNQREPGGGKKREIGARPGGP